MSAISTHVWLFQSLCVDRVALEVDNMNINYWVVRIQLSPRFSFFLIVGHIQQQQQHNNNNDDDDDADDNNN